MLATVCILTYNHAPYIAEAIESVLRQETSFDFEILIGEDDSSDGTREIVTRYRNEHPERIRVLLHDRKDNIRIDGRPTGRWNYIDTIQRAAGQYVALLDGDDLWVHPKKLQSQVELLESAPHLSACFTAYEVRRSIRSGPLLYTHHPPRRTPEYSLRELLEYNVVGAPLTVVFRNGLFGAFPRWYYALPIGDVALHILNARYGPIGYIDEVTAVYRVHETSYYSSQTMIDRNLMTIRSLELVRPHLTQSEQRYLNRALFRHHEMLSAAYRIECDASAARQHARKALATFLRAGLNSPLPFARALYFSLYQPRLHQAFTRFTGGSFTKTRKDV